MMMTMTKLKDREGVKYIDGWMYALGIIGHVRGLGGTDGVAVTVRCFFWSVIRGRRNKGEPGESMNGRLSRRCF